MTNKKIYETPMMQQYMHLKKKYSDCILFFRLGDFYEMFLDDAILGSEILGITLTSRSRGKDGKIPMAGVPYHAVSNYLNKLVLAGHKVAICEQLSDPSAGDLVERDVVRIVTPGTLLDESSLDRKENNYIMSLYLSDESIGLAVADISTGNVSVTSISNPYENELSAALEKFNPAELVLRQKDYENPKILKFLRDNNVRNVFPFDFSDETLDSHKVLLHKFFGVLSLESFGLDIEATYISAAALLVNYFNYTQKDNIHHIKSLRPLENTKYLQMDKSTIVNLELLKTIRDNKSRGSLVNHLDKTITAMGGRNLKTWLLNPLLNIEEIQHRQEVVSKYVADRKRREVLREILHHINDIERIVSRISVGLGNPRDLINLSNSLEQTLQVGELLDTKLCVENHIKSAVSDKYLNNLVDRITSTIKEDPPIDPKQGGVVKENVNTELDELNKKILDSKSWISNLEAHEKEKTGISSLKVSFNKVFGFYIEVSKSNLHLVPEYFDRKQTLVNAERFITPELKEHEEIILSAEERTNELEYTIFNKVCAYVLEGVTQLQEAASKIGDLDCLLTFSELSETNNYIRPQIVDKAVLRIKNGRHPVVENLLDSYEFVPNDTFLGEENPQLYIITGPNMAGKSVYIRQVALIVLLAQMGCYVPAEEASIGVVDKVFVRSGASDIITSGLSTFMVEMVETANILNNATNKSLIVMDEIGRGTSTFDGISIAWSVAEHLVTGDGQVSPRTLFATHYHELEELENAFPKTIRNYQMAIDNTSANPVFLHKLIAGGAGHSYGILVARLAGVPNGVIERAQGILKKLEEGEKIL